MNVDNFDEAKAILEEDGFTNSQGDKITYTPSSKATMMISPSGYAINLAEHIKKDN